MRVVVTIEHRYDRTPDGAVWASFFSYSFWRRYLEVFDSVRVVSRVRDVARPPERSARVDGDGVEIWPLPHYQGPWQYARRAVAVRRRSRAAVGLSEAVILRIDSQIAAGIEPLLRATGRPYGVEVVVDPHDIFAPRSGYPLAAVWRWWFPRQMRRQCARACAAAYVTKDTLQRRYPAGRGAYVTHYSSVELPPEAFAAAPRVFETCQRHRLVSVGTLDHLYKGQDVLLDAVAECVRSGVDLTLAFVGDGRHRPLLEERAAALGIGERVTFLGQLPAGRPVRDVLDVADLFVLPSRGEGLPRASIEAMARGLPAIGSDVGGYPEILPPEDLVPSGDGHALAVKIREVLAAPARMTAASARNLGRARYYEEAALRRRRNEFYEYLRQRTEEWGPDARLEARPR